MFRDYYSERTPEQVAKEFGPEFAGALFQLRAGTWQGPIPSGYGWHLVFVEAIEQTHTPAFEEVAPDVKSAWLDERQRQIKRAAFEAMRARYQVFVAPFEPKDLDSLPSPQGPPATADVVPQ
jgi:parvulin-like peptidyl-prolyl isomerase